MNSTVTQHIRDGYYFAESKDGTIMCLHSTRKQIMNILIEDIKNKRDYCRDVVSIFHINISTDWRKEP